MRPRYILFTLVLAACVRPTSIYTPESVNINTSTTDLKDYAGQRIEMSGEIKKEAFESKKGIVKDKFEYWMYPQGRTERILLNVPADGPGSWTGADITVKGILFYGNIDETDAQKQSRHGYRLDHVEKINRN